VREFDQGWSFTGTSGGGAAVQVTGDVIEMAWYARTGAASTATISVQGADESTGPWFTQASTVLATAAGTIMRVTGPQIWVRPHNNSTGIVTIRAIGVS
jgi:hypothetical protein